MELSYERDSRWRPHLSWNFSSSSLQQQMEEQAAQRELAWQRLTDRLGSVLIADGGTYKTFATPDHKSSSPTAFLTRGLLTSKYNFSNNHQQVHLECPEEDQELEKHQKDEEAYKCQQQSKEKYFNSSTPVVNYNLQHQHNIYDHYFQNKSSHYYYTNVPDDEMDYYEHYKRAKRRCVAVSTILISLTMLLFAIVILMALGIVHR